MPCGMREKGKREILKEDKGKRKEEKIRKKKG
jgi:hypothetical protein